MEKVPKSYIPWFPIKIDLLDKNHDAAYFETNTFIPFAYFYKELSFTPITSSEELLVCRTESFVEPNLRRKLC